ncbi:MAG: HAD family phosphatase [Anaerolineaceae bacterium]|nr:HAD family phosphatase [Anaerolineaceae bacterium]
MGQNIRAVIWDMGGVILRGSDYSSRERLVKRLGIERSEMEALVFNSRTSRLALLGKITEDAHWQEVGNALGLQGEALAQARKEFWSGNQMDSELVAFINSLRPRYRTGLLSNAWTGTRQSVGDKYPFLHVFDVSVFSDEVGMIKPNPAFYQWIVERLRVRPEEAAFIDDQMVNVEAARSLGMAAIQFLSRPQALQALRDLLPEFPIDMEG